MPYGVPNVTTASFANQARLDSGDIAVIAQGLAGDGVISGCAVTAQGSPNMTVAVAAGYVRINGAGVAVTAGNVTVTSNSSGLTRVDLVVVNSSGTKSVLAGTPGAAPLWPSASGYVILARVEVPSGVSAITSSHITDKRAVLPTPPVVNVKDYGAKGDTVVVTDGAITSGAATLTSATAAFTSTDVGKQVSVVGAGASGANLASTISAFTNSTTVTLAANASTTVSGATAVFGTADTAAFTAAKTAAGVGGKVFVPAGTYLLNNLALDVDGQTWELASGAVLKQIGAISSDKIIQVTGNDVTFTGGAIDLTGALGVVNTAFGVSKSGTAIDGFTIHHTTFRNMPSNGIGGVNVNRLRVEDCRFYNIARTCIYVNNQGSGNTNRDYIIANNFLDQTTVPTSPANWAGISIWGDSAARPVTDVQITGNVIRQNVPSASAATGPIGLLRAKDFVVANNVCDGGDMGISIPNAVNGTVANNTIRNFYSIGIEVPGPAGGPTPVNVTVDGNTIDAGAAASNQMAISISQGSTNEVISNNTFKGFAITGGGSYIRCDGVNTQLVISGNVFNDTQGNTSVAGVLLVPSGTFTACVINGNTFHGGATGTSNRAVQLEGTVNGLVVTGNQATNLLQSFVWATSSSSAMSNITLGANSLTNCGPPLLYALSGTATMTNFNGPSVRTTFSNAAYTATPVDRTLAQIGTLSGARVVTLPAASSVAPGTTLQLVDESGTATGTNTLSWSRAGSDTINGGTANVVAVNAAYGTGDVKSDGTSKWTTVVYSVAAAAVGGDLTGTVSNAQIAAGAIVNADINASAAIANTKIAATRTTFSNANYTAVATDRLLAQTGTLSAARVVTLPAANAVPGGTTLVIVDESGTVTSANTISWARAGSDTINGGTGNVLAVNAAYGVNQIVSDGTSKWIVVPPAVVNQVNATITGRAGVLVAETAGSTNTIRWYNRAATTMTITALYASVDLAPTGSAITVTVWKNGSSTGAQTITISAAANSGSTTGLSISLTPGDYLQAWPTAIGSTVAGSDLAVTAVGTY